MIYWMTDIFKYNLSNNISDIRYNSVPRTGGDIMHGHMHMGEYCECKPWDSLSKKEKLEILENKKKWLDAKSKKVEEAIKEIEKGK